MLLKNLEDLGVLKDENSSHTVPKKEAEKRKIVFVGAVPFERLTHKRHKKTKECDKHSRLYLAQPLAPASPQGLSPINPRAPGKLASSFLSKLYFTPSSQCTPGTGAPWHHSTNSGTSHTKTSPVFSPGASGVRTTVPFGSTGQNGKEIFPWRCEPWEGTCCASSNPHRRELTFSAGFRCFYKNRSLL